jgi:hypothetical protein
MNQPQPTFEIPQNTPLEALLIQKLDKLISVTEEATHATRISQRLWTAKDVGFYLGNKPATFVLNRLHKTSGFPRPICIASGVDVISHPMWKPEEIKAWATKHRG